MSRDGFSLPVTPFELAMLADDRPSHPMTFGMRLGFDRPLDFAAATVAARAAARNHPRLRGRIERIDASRPAGVRWSLARGDVPSACGELSDRPRPVDLVRGPGLRMTQQGAALQFDFHHACIDGLGVARFLEEFFWAFGEPTASSSGHRRSEAVPTRRAAPTATRRLPFVARRIAGFFRSRPRPIAAGVQRTPVGPAWHTGALSVAETDGLRHAAKRLGVTVNDLLIRDLFLTVERWNAERGWPGGFVRLAVPMSTRDGDATETGNNVSMVFIDRAVRRAGPAELLRSVAAETATVRRERLAAALLRALAVLARVPGGIRHVYAAPRCQGTAVVSNVGVLFGGRTVRAGGAGLREVYYLPPVRPLTRAAFVVATYAGRLGVGAAVDPTVLGGDDGRRRLERYLNQLRVSASAGATGLGP